MIRSIGNFGRSLANKKKENSLIFFYFSLLVAQQINKQAKERIDSSDD